MNKKIYTLASLALIAAVTTFSPTESSAITLSSVAGKVITPTLTSGGPAFSFQPSPQVSMAGTSVKESFAIVAAHDSAIGKDNGEAYYMASAVTGLYFKKNPVAADATTAPTIGTIPTGFKLPGGS